MKALQAQPTLNPALIHHIQRQHITIRPNIKVRIGVTRQVGSCVRTQVVKFVINIKSQLMVMK